MVHERLLLGDQRQRVALVHDIAVDRRLADRIDLQLTLVAPQRDGVAVGGGLQRLQLGDVVLLAQVEQHVTGADILAGFEMNAVHDA